VSAATRPLPTVTHLSDLAEPAPARFSFKHVIFPGGQGRVLKRGCLGAMSGPKSLLSASGGGAVSASAFAGFGLYRRLFSAELPRPVTYGIQVLRSLCQVREVLRARDSKAVTTSDEGLYLRTKNLSSEPVISQE
jgi:hypothetical protein